MTAGLMHLLGHIDAGRWHRWRGLLRYLRLARVRTLDIDGTVERRRYRSLSLIVANAPFTGAGILWRRRPHGRRPARSVRSSWARRSGRPGANWLRLLLGRPLRERPEVVSPRLDELR